MDNDEKDVDNRSVSSNKYDFEESSECNGVRTDDVFEHHNSGGHAGSEFRKRKLVKNEATRNVKPRTGAVQQETSSVSYYYEDACPIIDMVPEVYENVKKQFLKRYAKKDFFMTNFLHSNILYNDTFQQNLFSELL